MSNTPVYAWPYQTLSDSPHGPNLGHDLALAVESTVHSVDGRLTANETGVTTLTSQMSTLTTTVNNQGLYARGVIARGVRSAPKSGMSAESGLVRVNATLLANRSYVITTSTMIIASTVNEAAQVTVYMKADTTGSNATLSSAVLAEARIVTQPGSGTGSSNLNKVYTVGGSNVTLSVLLSAVRGIGTGTLSVSGPAGGGPEINIIDMGPAVANSGVDL